MYPMCPPTFPVPTFNEQIWLIQNIWRNCLKRSKSMKNICSVRTTISPIHIYVNGPGRENKYGSSVECWRFWFYDQPSFCFEEHQTIVWRLLSHRLAVLLIKKIQNNISFLHPFYYNT